MIPRILSCFGLVLVLSPGLRADVASTNGFGKYQVIIDKSPFRKFAAPTAAPAAQSMIGSLMLAGLYDSGEEGKGAWVKDTKTGKHYLVSEGTNLMEWKVEKIDIENQSVEMLSGLDRQLLKFPDRVATPAPVAAAPQAPRTAYRGPLRPLTPLPANVPTTPSTPPAVVPANTSATPAVPAPTSLRRRILRQRAQPPEPNPPAEEQAAEGENTDEGGEQQHQDQQQQETEEAE